MNETFREIVINGSTQLGPVEYTVWDYVVLFGVLIFVVVMFEIMQKYEKKHLLAGKFQQSWRKKS